MSLELLKKGKIEEFHKSLDYKKDIGDYHAEYENSRDIRANQVGNRVDKKSRDNKTLEVNKITIPKPKQIVLMATAFIFGKKLKLTRKNTGENLSDEEKEKSKELFENAIDIWTEIRIDATLKKMCKAVKSETVSAIIFYTKGENVKDLKLRTRLVTHETGKCIPIFNDFGDMEAFVWEFKSKKEGKTIDNMYVWTAETQYKYQREGVWKEIEKKPNLFKKIPVVYLEQKHPEWWDVKGLIDRYENSVSKMCDVNDYFADPKYKTNATLDKSIVDSDVIQMSTKVDDDGNVIEPYLDILSWERAPESVKLELSTIKDLIYELSNTPSLSIEEKKGFGNLANYAMELLFLGPVIKANDAADDYDIVVKRCFSIVKSFMVMTNILSKNEVEELQVEVTFNGILPKNVAEIIEILNEATGNKSVMSRERAVSLNPMVENATEEFKKMKEEEEEEAAQTIGESVIE